jgi:hypothetical protein
MKCQKGKGSIIIPGRHDDFSYIQCKMPPTTIDIKATDTFLQDPKEPRGSCECHRGTEVWIEVKTRKIAVGMSLSA